MTSTGALQAPYTYHDAIAVAILMLSNLYADLYNKDALELSTRSKVAVSCQLLYSVRAR